MAQVRYRSAPLIIFSFSSSIIPPTFPFTFALKGMVSAQGGSPSECGSGIPPYVIMELFTVRDPGPLPSMLLRVSPQVGHSIDSST